MKKVVVVSNDLIRGPTIADWLYKSIPHRSIETHSFLETKELLGSTLAEETDVFVIDMPTDEGSLTATLVKLIKEYHMIFFINDSWGSELREITKVVSSELTSSFSIILSTDPKVLDVIAQNVAKYVYSKDVRGAINTLLTSRHGDTGQMIRYACWVIQLGWPYLDIDTKEYVKKEGFDVDETTNPISVSPK